MEQPVPSPSATTVTVTELPQLPTKPVPKYVPANFPIRKPPPCAHPLAGSFHVTFPGCCPPSFSESCPLTYVVCMVCHILWQMFLTSPLLPPLTEEQVCHEFRMVNVLTSGHSSQIYLSAGA